jgi:hypothetical protein
MMLMAWYLSARTFIDVGANMGLYTCVLGKPQSVQKLLAKSARDCALTKLGDADLQAPSVDVIALDDLLDTEIA